MHTAAKHVSTGAAGRTTRRRPGRPPDPLDTVSLNGDRVRNAAGEEIGCIEGVMLDGGLDRILYAVLSLRALSRDGRLFAVPWTALRVSGVDGGVVLAIPEEHLRSAPAFERGSWPSIADHAWRDEVDAYYRPWCKCEGHEHQT